MHAAGFIRTAYIESPITAEIPIGRLVAVTAENAVKTLPEIGYDHDIGLVISSAGFDPCFPLTHLVGSSQITVPVLPSDFQATKLVEQKEVNHTGNRVRTIDSGGAIL